MNSSDNNNSKESAKQKEQSLSKLSQDIYELMKKTDLDYIFVHLKTEKLNDELWNLLSESFSISESPLINVKRKKHKWIEFGAYRDSRKEYYSIKLNGTPTLIQIKELEYAQNFIQIANSSKVQAALFVQMTTEKNIDNQAAEAFRLFKQLKLVKIKKFTKTNKPAGDLKDITEFVNHAFPEPPQFMKKLCNACNKICIFFIILLVSCAILDIMIKWLLSK